MGDSLPQPPKEGDTWRSSLCPVLRPLCHEERDRVSYERLLSYCQDEIGVVGIMLWAIRRHTRDIGTADGMKDEDLVKSFIYDSVYSGVTRHGTNREVFDRIYGILDPDGTAGSRLISNQQLPRLAAALRLAFQNSRINAIKREIGIIMATVEWTMLIRCFGDEIDNRIVLSEQVHWSMLESKSPQKVRKRTLGLIQLLPGFLAWQKSFFVRLREDDRAIATKQIGCAVAKDVVT